MNNSVCPAAALAKRAVELFEGLRSGNHQAGERLIEVEEAATKVMAASREGAAYQLGVAATLLDDIISRFPEHSPEMAHIEARRVAIERLLASAIRQLVPSASTGEPLGNYGKSFAEAAR